MKFFITISFAIGFLLNGNEVYATDIFNTSVTFQEAVNSAKTKDVLLMTFLCSNTCKQSQLMQASTFQKPEVVQLLTDDFYPVKINADSENGKNWVNQFNISTFPTILFFDKKGNLIKKTEAMLHSTDFIQEMDAVITYAASGHWPMEEKKSTTTSKSSKPCSTIRGGIARADRSVASTACMKSNPNAKSELNQKGPFRIFVQEFPDGTDMEKIVLDLKRQFKIAPTVGHTTHDNQTFYRLYIGEFDQVDDALLLQIQLQEKGFTTAQVTTLTNHSTSQTVNP